MHAGMPRMPWYRLSHSLCAGTALYLHCMGVLCTQERAHLPCCPRHSQGNGLDDEILLHDYAQGTAEEMGVMLALRILQDQAEVAVVEMMLEAYQMQLEKILNKVKVSFAVLLMCRPFVCC